MDFLETCSFDQRILSCFFLGAVTNSVRLRALERVGHAILERQVGACDRNFFVLMSSCRAMKDFRKHFVWRECRITFQKLNSFTSKSLKTFQKTKRNQLEKTYKTKNLKKF